MTKKDSTVIKCPHCKKKFVDKARVKLRQRLVEAGRKRQAMSTPEERARNVAASQVTKAFNKMQKERHDALGLKYVKGKTVLTDAQWAEAWKASPMAELQHPSA